MLPHLVLIERVVSRLFSIYASAVAKAIAKRPQSAARGTASNRGGPTSIVGDRFDAILIPQLNRHCTGWQSAAVFIVCLRRVPPLVGAQWIFEAAKPPLAILKPTYGV